MNRKVNQGPFILPRLEHDEIHHPAFIVSTEWQTTQQGSTLELNGFAVMFTAFIAGFFFAFGMAAAQVVMGWF